MNLKDVMKNDKNIFFNEKELARKVEYNGQEIKGIVNLGSDTESGNTFSNDGRAARAEITIARADISSSPDQGDIINILNSNYTFKVARILNSDEYIFKLECIANESPW